MPGGGCALPGLRSYDLSLIYSLFLLKLPVLTASKSLRRSRQAGAAPHGCGLRAVFCRDAASARPEACRDKSKAPRSGDFAGRSPGVQGAAATGRPLCAPSAMSDIAQKKYWERNLSGNNIEAVALPGAVCTGKFTLVPLFRRVAAGALPGLLVRLRLSPGPASAAPPGDGIRYGAAFMPGGGCALPGLQGLSGLGRLNPQACRKIYPLRYSSRQLSTGQPYPAPAACSCGQGLTSRTRSACRHSGRSLMESV